MLIDKKRGRFALALLRILIVFSFQAYISEFLNIQIYSRYFNRVYDVTALFLNFKR